MKSDIKYHQITLEESNKNILVQLEESNKKIKISNQDFKAEFNTNLKIIELSNKRIEGKKMNNFKMFLILKH